ncbi:MAG: thiamine phosphate synthase [Prochlorococcus sp. SP3034]|nr:thiamine phosphate synthase [Prochlorococcus sp. SP3034]|tara:strand:+ start:7538 stop:8593 length:1056 start_codon:yes stop_codon:yes gene_type:complete
MKDFINKAPTNKRIAQIIDANLDRAREGLRVLEDWARFGIRRDDLVVKLKNFRQVLGKHHLKVYKDARDVTKDPSTGLTHHEQDNRKSVNHLISANAARVQEALRVIEEYSRNENKELSLASSKIRYEIYSIEITLLSCASNKKRLSIIKNNNLYFITNQTPNLIKVIESVLKGGVKIIQHRFKDGKDSKNLQEAIKIKRLCDNYKALFIINDRIDIALACDADGIHLGQDDIDIKSARKILGFSKIIGISANKSSEIKSAIKNGCDYLGIGPVFETATKRGKKPLGLDKIKKLSDNLSIPFFVIGGINKTNLHALKKFGLKKIAMVSEIANAENPEETAIMLIKELSYEN